MSHHHVLSPISVLSVLSILSVVAVVVVVVVVVPGIALQVRWNPLRVIEPSVSKLISTLDIYFLVIVTRNKTKTYRT